MGIFEDVAELQTQMAAVQSDLTSMQSDIDTLANDSGWINLTLEDGWTMNDYTAEVPQYRKIGKIVMLRGLVNATAAADRKVATLPEGFRPISGWYNRYNSVLNQSDYVNVQINPNGDILDYNKTTSVGRAFVCLSNIVFMAN